MSKLLGLRWEVGESELVRALEAWFGVHRALDGVWDRNPVGRLIREELKAQGRWKNRPRGNPKKGYLVAKGNND